MKRGKDQYVMHHYKGGWAVKGSGNTKPTRVVRTLNEAITIAEGIAYENNANVRIYASQVELSSSMINT